jgi:hypothetical protein
VLAKNTILKKIGLSKNQTAETGVHSTNSHKWESGVIALSKSTTLICLNLGWNKITDAEAIDLSKNITLRQLNLNRIIEIILMNKQLIKIISRLVKKEFLGFLLKFIST